MIAKLFRAQLAPVVDQSRSIDLAKLDDGLNELKRTTAEVSKAAANASILLQEEHKRTKACFIALNSASDGIVILDRAGHIFFCNDQFMQANNIAHHNEVVGKHILDVFPNFPNFEHVWQSCKDNNTEVVYCPGTKLKLTIVPMMNGAPEPVYHVCTFKSPK